MVKSALCMALGMASVSISAAEKANIISEQEAIKAALGAVNVEVLGIRFDKPDTQWDVFVKLGDQAYEVEVDAVTGKIVAAEKESLKEVLAELSGDLSHEGVEGDVDK
ncbi:peptidase [Photobacterium aphoticum]|nr:peptidase [Photobacterium aphoticum]